VVFAVLIAGSASAQVKDESDSKLNADHVYVHNKDICQDIYLTAAEDTKATVYLELNRINNPTDSLLLYRYTFEDLDISQGARQIRLKFKDASGTRNYLNPVFAKVLRKCGSLPPGNYNLHIRVEGKNLDLRTSIIQEIDSALGINSSYKKSINAILVPVKGNALFSGNKGSSGRLFLKDKAGTLLGNNERKLEKYARKNGLQQVRGHSDSKEYIDLYTEGWFIGRYELYKEGSGSAQIQSERQSLESNIGSLATNELGHYHSLMSQIRKMKEEQKGDRELTGEIAVAGNFSNGQEEGSDWDNNFYEIRGDLRFPVLDIPVMVSGYYTTQDKHRQAKASYIRFSYDAAKAKEQLMKLIGSYNSRYEQTVTQGGNLDMIYGQYVAQLKQEKSRAIAELRQSAGLDNFNPGSYSADMLEGELSSIAAKGRQRIQDSLENRKNNLAADSSVADKTAKIAAAEKKANEAYRSAQDKYEQIMALEKKISHYQSLLNQYRNTLHYDSLLAYNKIKDLKKADAASYKDMAKSASALLPEGKAKSLVAGLTSFDAGMFPKYVSDYTQSGQMMKGIDVGYDIGIAEVGATYGKTEYIDRTGNVESYKAYGGRAMLKPVAKQQVGIVYYGYSPGASILEDNNFFKGSDVSLPSFRNPVHIFSGIYKGELGKYASASGEYAFSNKQGQSAEATERVSFHERSAYNLHVTGNIPSTSIDIDAGYEHAGKAFENNTLPMTMAGTDRLKLAAKGTFFRSFLTLGIEYNYLTQNSFYSKGNNSRWGFDIATHSKRYPSVYLSYKPFSTFRSYDDTLSIAQKPLYGEVWTGRASYQVKRLDKAIRFTLLYNRNTSIMDTVSYGSTLVQLTTILSDKTRMLLLNLGFNDVNSGQQPLLNPAYNKSRFAGATGSFMVAGNLNLTAGSDVAWSRMGFSRYSFLAGTAYTFKNVPVMVRASFRYSNYKLNELTGWKQLYTGGIELAYRLNMKLGKR